MFPGSFLTRGFFLFSKKVIRTFHRIKTIDYIICSVSIIISVYYMNELNDTLYSFNVKRSR